MFTDLEGYRAFATGKTAQETAQYLNERYTWIGPIIEAHDGTIDNYFGDGLMAFWGAPEPLRDHADRACDAAQDIADAFSAFCDMRRRAGLNNCRLRIGLHTGPVLVGNIGHAGRIHYTIIGEAANIAQRVEQAGKRTSSNVSDAVVLVSDLTYGLTSAKRPAHEGPVLDNGERLKTFVLE